MKYNEYDIVKAKINKNLVGDIVVLKPTGSKISNMPTWFKTWTETQFEPRMTKVEIFVKDQKLFNEKVQTYMDTHP